MKRRAFLSGLAALTASPAALAHTPYGQWVAYRRKHLLIGCYKSDPRTYALAQRLVGDLAHNLEDASARVARAPNPERLASLIATGQMETAILAPSIAAQIAAGQDSFAPYGAIELRAIATVDEFLFVATSRMPERHAWLLAYAIEQPGTPVAHPAIPLHSGVQIYRNGQEIPDAPVPSE